MSTLVFSGYESPDKTLPQSLLMVSEYQSKWAKSINAHFDYNTQNLISVDIQPEISVSSGSRGKAMLCDRSRIRWIKHYLTYYNQVIWLDGDLLPLRNFNPDLSEHIAPHMLREIMISSYNPDTGNYSFKAETVTITIMNFYKSHVSYIDAHLSTQLAISKNCSPDREWWIYGTTLAAGMHKIFNFPLINGTAFLTKSVLNYIWDSKQLTNEYFDQHNKKWSKYDCRVSSINLSTNKDDKQLVSWIRLLESEGYL